MTTVPASWDLPADLRAHLNPKSVGRQRTIVSGGQLLLVLHKLPKPDESSRRGVHFWRDLDGRWHTSASGTADATLRRHVQEYAKREAELNEAHDAADSLARLFELQAEVTPVARAARNMHAALTQAADALPEDAVLVELRDVSYDIERNLDLLREDIQSGIAFRVARETEEQNRLSREALQAGHRLNILAALFLPLTAVGSLFGMNLQNGLADRHPVTFYVIMLLALAGGAAMVLWVLGKLTR